MFKGQQDQRLRHMLKLGKSNITYLGSGKQIPGPIASSSIGIIGPSEQSRASQHDVLGSFQGTLTHNLKAHG